MTAYKPQVGDRVRVVLEGEVRQIHSDGDLTIWATHGYPTDIPHEANFSVEKVAPPVEVFGPGDVVRRKITGSMLLLGREGYMFVAGGTVGHSGDFLEYSQYFGRDEFTSEDYERVSLGGDS